MAKILLDYAFPISVVTPTPAASTAFLKQACVVVKPLTPGSGTGVITACTSQTQIAALTGNLEAQQLLNGGMSKVYILPMDDLGLASALEDATDFFTLLISSDFDGENEDSYAEGEVEITSYANLVDGTDDTVTIAGVAFTAQEAAVTEGAATFQAATSNDATADSLADQINAHAVVGTKVEAVADGAVVTITSILPGYEGHYALSYQQLGSGVGATVSGSTLTGGEELLDIGTFSGVTGLYSQSAEAAATHAAMENRVCFFGNNTNKAKNMMYAFGKFLSNSLNWSNQQYISMNLGGEVTTLGDAESLFDDKVSFVISDDEYLHRLGLFAVGGKAIVAPYILKNLRIDLQSKALQWISANQPQYTLKEATLLEARLQEDVINLYIARNWIPDGTVDIRLEQDNFVASGYINVAEPKALWRVVGEMRQTL
jgi:hypothetical protein